VRNHGPRAGRVRTSLVLSLVAAGAVGAQIGLPSASGAAAPPPTPESLTNCGGTLTADSSGAAQGQPNLLDYSFNCDTPISAYTITIDRQPGDTGNIDNYSPTASGVGPAGVVNTTESITCEGLTPSNGVNCNAGAGGFLNSYDQAQGSIDLVAPYCRYLPPKGKPGTAAIPQAIVSVVVTDNTGAEDGPFTLALTTKCKKVPSVVPVSTKGTASGKKKGK